MRYTHRAFSFILAAMLSAGPAEGRKWLSLGDVITIAQRRSYNAKSARLKFIASYWTYRSFRAQLLPSVNASGSLLNFDHSRVEARDADNGLINYVDNNSLANSLTLSIDQEIPATGGTVSLQSYLYRLDQFDYSLTTYNSQPLRISYTQPLRSYNSLKWEKKTAPVEYEKAQKVYLEDMENVTIQAAQLFFGAITAQTEYRQSVKKLEDMQDMYETARKRFDIGVLTKSDMLQLELSVLNAKVAVTNDRITLDKQLFNLFTFLRLSDYDGAELAVPEMVPEVTVNVDEAVGYALDNSSHSPEQTLTMLQARQAVAQARSQRGIQLQLKSEIGFSKTANAFGEAYRRPGDNEIVGLSLSLPVFDWGVSKGRVHVAEAKLQLARVQVEQERDQFVQDVRMQVVQFMSQAEQCRTAQRAGDISAERYEISKRRFGEGTITVTDLNTALQEAETARMQYIGQLQTFWTDYYTLRRTTLYDWQRRCRMSADYDKLLNARYEDD